MEISLAFPTDTASNSISNNNSSRQRSACPAAKITEIKQFTPAVLAKVLGVTVEEVLGQDSKARRPVVNGRLQRVF